MVEYVLRAARPQEALATAAFHRYVSPTGGVWTEFLRRDDGYLLRFPDLGDFVISADGTKVEGHPAPGVDESTVEHLYLNVVRPLALSRQGRLAFHAAAVTVPGGAIALLGRSGVGKSTLATQFARTGASFLTDDGLLLEPWENGYRVLPNHPSIRLWRDSQQALLEGTEVLAPPVSYTSKSRVLAGTGLTYCDEPQPLLSAWLLDHSVSEEIAIRRATPAEAVLAWIRNSFLLDVEDREALRRNFQHATVAGHAIPAYHLDYPRRFDRLADVQAAIVRHVGAGGDARHGH